VTDLSGRSATQSGKIAVVGERELVLGYRLLGVQDAFLAGREDAQKIVTDLFNSNEYALIIIGNQARTGLSSSMKEKLESSITPLVVFMPSLDSQSSEESLSLLARRVLGVDLKVNAS
jgi:V/A-type H+-transporting ATPase subunit F